MIVILSGEGPTDLGSCINGIGICQTPIFEIGPMTILINDIVSQVLNYDVLETTPHIYRYISKLILINQSEHRKQTRRVYLPGKKHGIETGYFYTNAWMLGEIAHNIENEESDSSIAILFRDSDGTNSSFPGLWESKRESMISGFTRAKYARGVPMVPKPKSESWLLCAAKNNPYQHCANLENLPGNDDSPNSAKSQLDKALNGETTRNNINYWLAAQPFQHDTVADQMPSYAAFKETLVDVVTACIS